MANTKRLNEIIEDKGIKKTIIAEKMKISYGALMNRLNGTNDFYSDEIVSIAHCLNLSIDEVRDIFLSDL